MNSRENLKDLEDRIKKDPEFAWQYVQELQQEIETTIKDEQQRLAQAVFDLMEADITEVEALDKECPEDKPVTYCIHDLKAMLFNTLYEVMHRKLGFHIERLDGVDQLVPGPCK